MSYKLQSIFLGNPNDRIVDLDPPDGSGWHIESITPVTSQYNESDSVSLTSAWDTVESKSKSVEMRNRNGSNSLHLLILWKRYVPTQRELNDMVIADIKDASTWG